MTLPRLVPSRLACAVLLMLGVVGCATTPPAKPPAIDEGKVKAVKSVLKEANMGRILGLIVADQETLSWAGVPSLAGAKAQAFDQDGTALSPIAEVDAEGHFTITGMRESRKQIFIEADVNGLRFRTLAAAPRGRKDYGVTLDAASTYLADKMRRSSIDVEVYLDRLDNKRLDETQDLVDVYMDRDDRREVLEQEDADLNAYAFDHFMDDHLPVKVAVYQISPAILRGWTPTQPQFVVPTARPTPRPVVVPTPTPDPNAPPTGGPTDPPPK